MHGLLRLPHHRSNIRRSRPRLFTVHATTPVRRRHTQLREIVARADALAYDQGKAILSIDIKNFLNTTLLSIIHDGLLQTDPALLHYFRWRYWNPSTLRDNTGSVAAFDDDIQVRSDPRIIFQLASLIKDIFVIDGFTVNKNKCKIAGAGITALPNASPHGFEIQESGTTALAIPIGNEQLRTATTRSKTEAMAPPTAALQLLTPRSAILLLSQCICHRPGFLLRTASDLVFVMPFTRTFDEQIRLAVEDTLRMDRHDDARAQIFRPATLVEWALFATREWPPRKGS